MIGSGGFREAIRTSTVSYPIPFMFAALLAFALACFGLATLSLDALRWVLAVIGALCTLGAVGLAAYAVVFREGLLRSERHSLAQRYIEALGDSDMDQAARDALSRTILGFVEETKPKKASRPHLHGRGKVREGEGE